MIKIFQSEDVRRGFSNMIDDVIAGHEIVINRYQKPKAVMINYAEWQELREVKMLLQVQHIDTEYEQLLNQRSEEMRVDPSMRIPFTKKELVSRSLINT